MSDRDIEERFHQEMLNIYQNAKTECRYNATRFRQMVNDVGGLEAARVLLRGTDLSYGFTALWECGRLDLTMEALVLRSPWSDLFTPEEAAIARKRLEQLGWRD